MNPNIVRHGDVQVCLLGKSFYDRARLLLVRAEMQCKRQLVGDRFSHEEIDEIAPFSLYV